MRSGSLNAEAVRDISPCRLAGSCDLAHLAFLLDHDGAGTQEMDTDKEQHNE